MKTSSDYFRLLPHFCIKKPILTSSETGSGMFGLEDSPVAREAMMGDLSVHLIVGNEKEKSYESHDGVEKLQKAAGDFGGQTVWS